MRGSRLLTDSDFSPPSGFSRGCKKIAAESQFGNCSAAEFPEHLLIDRSEIQDRIAEQKKNRTQLTDFLRRNKFELTQQARTNYCWAHSSCNAMNARRCLSNAPIVDLSPAAVACKIKGYRNVGGMNSESMAWLMEHGCPSTKFWQENSRSKAGDNEETWDNADNHRVTLCYRIDPRDTQQICSALLRYMPIAMDFPWWKHSVCGMDLQNYWARTGEIEIEIGNSWTKNWGYQGYGRLKGNKALPLWGAIAVCSVTV